MLIHTKQPRAEAIIVTSCRRCGQSGLEGGIAVCAACRTQEEVARHCPPARRWSLFR
jgi:ribosomal protein L37E